MNKKRDLIKHGFLITHLALIALFSLGAMIAFALVYPWFVQRIAVTVVDVATPKLRSAASDAKTAPLCMSSAATCICRSSTGEKIDMDDAQCRQSALNGTPADFKID